MKMIAAVLLVAAASATAAAQPKSTPSDGSSLAAQDCARARKAGKQCVLTFGTEEVNGRLVGPDGSQIDAAGIMTFGSLIRLRTDFRAEIISAADWI